MTRDGQKFDLDEELLEKLYAKYAKGGLRVSGWRQWAYFFAKKSLWIFVVESARALKRVMDIVGSAAGLLLLSPVFLVTALLIKIEDRGSIFYGQDRVGKWGKIFRMYKFRSMIVNADKMKDTLLDQNESGGVIFKMKRDPRICLLYTSPSPRD